MSSRAIQRLRQERESERAKKEVHESEEEEDDDDDNHHGSKPKTTKFVAMMDDSSSEEEDDDDESREDTEIEKETNDDDTTGKATTTTLESAEKEGGEVDLDALLDEFKLQDNKEPAETDTTEEKKMESCYFEIITSQMDVRDLDVEYVMRTSLLGSSESSAPQQRSTNNRRARQGFLFGPPRDGWVRPPHYVGGGIIMTTYDENSRPLPWPYNDMKEEDRRSPGNDRWFTFTHSDSYSSTCDVDYNYIKATGDPNALAAFVADNPFVTEALLQLAAVLYQTNQNQEGLGLLRRTLYVYECAAVSSFTKMDGRSCLMDYQQTENVSFFNALFHILRVSHVAG
jgi:hypothetical protein